MRHQHRVVLVTGALGGIGAAIVQRYLEEGAKVALVDFNEQAGIDAVKTLRAEGHEVTFGCADVADFDQCQSACSAIEAALGPIDTLVLNAGISPKREGRKVPIHELDPAEWRRVIGVNLDGAFNLSGETSGTCKEARRSWTLSGN